MKNTTYNCDLCEADVTNSVSHSLTVRSKTGGQDIFDICDPCQRRLDKVIIKKEWKTP